MNLAALAFVMLCGYLLGSIPSGIIASRAFARVDVRAVGSGHTGTLNTVRAAGLAAGLLVFLADTSKAVVAVEWGLWAAGNEWGMALAGTAAVIGHCWPIYAHWKGGMGLATAGAALFVLDLPLLVLLIPLWFVVRYLVKSSPRASMTIAVLLPVLLLLSRADASLVAFGMVTCGVLLVRHLRAYWEMEGTGRSPKGTPGGEASSS